MLGDAGVKELLVLKQQADLAGERHRQQHEAIHPSDNLAALILQRNSSETNAASRAPAGLFEFDLESRLGLTAAPPRLIVRPLPAGVPKSPEKPAA